MSVSTEALLMVVNRMLAERELREGPVNDPERWRAVVLANLKRDHAGRIATMPSNLGISDQARWIEHGPPAQGARIPPPREPLTIPDKMPADAWRAGMDEARQALRKS